mgnify:CR=1 FL=1
MKITNKKKLPKPLVRSVEREYKYKKDRYSVSSLLNGSTETILKRRHYDEIEKDVSELVWAIFGNSVHKLIEHHTQDSKDLSEYKLEYNIDGVTISGIIDYYSFKDKEIIDYKSSSVWKVVHKDYESWKNQLYIYAYLMNKLGFEVKSVKNIVFLKDHSKGKAKFDKKYPQTPLKVLRFDFNDKVKEDIEKLIKVKIKAIRQAEKTPDKDLPPCSEKERWYTGDKYAVMKKGKKRAVKLYTDKKQAYKRAQEDDSYYVQERPGINKKCEEYCDVKEFCPFYKQMIGDEDLPFWYTVKGLEFFPFSLTPNY